MPLPTPNLDDRHFQDIVDEAKRLIPRFCPEWTDHNVSDPGVALIELFAWMTDLLLYRVNQVPDKVYITLLNLIGIQLEPPQSAVAPVTFYLSAPQETAITIPADTEVATVRTETSPAVIFTTETDLTIHPAVVVDDKVYTRQVERSNIPAS
jgi:predicted phage baseplate assembly protein